jgi:hypothetical protein
MPHTGKTEPADAGERMHWIGIGGRDATEAEAGRAALSPLQPHPTPPWLEPALGGDGESARLQKRPRGCAGLEAVS